MARHADSLSIYQTAWALAQCSRHNIAEIKNGITSTSSVQFFESWKSLPSNQGFYQGLCFGAELQISGKFLRVETNLYLHKREAKF